MGKPELRAELDAEAASVVGEVYTGNPPLRAGVKAALWTVIANAIIDYMGDLAGAWDALNITGTPSKLAGFDAFGNPTYYNLGGGGGVTDHFDLNAPSLVWEDSAHTGDNDSVAGFDSGGAAVSYVIGVDVPSNADVVSAAMAAEAAANAYTDGEVAAGVALANAYTDAAIAGVATLPIDLATDVTGDLPYANFTQGTARSVLAVAGNAGADWAPLQGTTAYHTLRVNNAGTGLEFGAVDLSTAGAAGDLPFSKLVPSAAGYGVVAKVGNGAGDFAEFVLAADRVLGRVAGADIDGFAWTAAGRTLLGAADAAAQRTALSLVVGTNVQQWSSVLDVLAAGTVAPVGPFLAGAVSGTTAGEVFKASFSGDATPDSDQYFYSFYGSGGRIGGIYGANSATKFAIGADGGSELKFYGNGDLDLNAERIYLFSQTEVHILVLDVNPWLEISTGNEGMTLYGDRNVYLNGSGSVGVPGGTEAQRPANAGVDWWEGQFRWNTDSKSFEGTDGISWFGMAPRFGTEAIDFGDSPGTNISAAATYSDVLVTATTVAWAWFQATPGQDETGTHNTYEHMMASMWVRLVCEAVPGVGIKIYGVSESPMSGEFFIHLAYVR